LSRIWEALKQAERQRVRAEGRDTAGGRAKACAEDDSDRRKASRIPHKVPLLVYGSDADKQPFHEEADTIDANDEGCLLTLETVVARGQRLFLINMRTQAEQECKVAHVGKRVGGKARIGLAFLAPAPYFWHSS
jgi:hypothetical protein